MICDLDEIIIYEKVICYFIINYEVCK